MQNGDILEIDSVKASIVDKVPAENLYFDGKTIRNVKSHLISDRKDLSRNGIIYIHISSLTNHRSQKSFTLNSHGLFEHVTDTEILENTKNYVQTLLANSTSKDINLENIKSRIITEVKSFVSKNTGKKPIVIVEIQH